jgi:hypothetical protein
MHTKEKQVAVTAATSAGGWDRRTNPTKIMLMTTAIEDAQIIIRYERFMQYAFC